MRRFNREKPDGGSATLAVNYYWNTQKTEAERRQYLRAGWQNLVWFEVRRAVFEVSRCGGRTIYSHDNATLARYVASLRRFAT